LGQHRQAIDLHSQALQITAETNSGQARIAANVGLADAYRSSGLLAEAHDHCSRAVKEASALGHQLLLGRARTAMARVQTASRQPETAVATAKQAVALHRSANHRLAEAEALAALAEAEECVGRAAAAHCHRQEAKLLHSAATSIGSVSESGVAGPPSGSAGQPA